MALHAHRYSSLVDHSKPNYLEYTMPTSSGVTYRQAGSNKLLSKRPSSPPRSYAYRHTSGNLYGGSSVTPKASVKERNAALLSPTDRELVRGFNSGMDLNHNYQRTSYKSNYGTDYGSPSSTSSGAYGSHYSNRNQTYSPSSGSNTLSGINSRLTSSSRSSSVDSNHNLSTRPLPRRTSIASQNRNESCSSYDTDTPSGGSDDKGNVGLTNLGNTCFMNSVLQCLFNTKALKDYAVGNQLKKDLNRVTSSMKGALMEEYSKLVKSVWEDSYSSIAPRELKKYITRFAPRFGGYNQQDAQEFLRYLLQGLHEDVNRVQTKPKYIGNDEEKESRMKDDEKAREYWMRYINFDDSFIVDLFVGQLKSELTCMSCGNKSVTFDPFWDLSLPIPKNRHGVDIEDCMESFMSEEMLDDDDAPTCGKCKLRRKSAKKFKIQKFPKILVLHLKRFSGERFRQKLSTKVNFELNGFNVRRFAVDADKEVKYNLYGISNHVGSVYSGHYSAYCKHPYKRRWYSFNDSRVSSISERDLVSEEAYVLFYERVE